MDDNTFREIERRYADAVTAANRDEATREEMDHAHAIWLEYRQALIDYGRTHAEDGTYTGGGK